MKIIQNPHDRVFKVAMSQSAVAKAFFEAHLPPNIIANANWQTLELCAGSFISEELQQHSSDILYRLQIADEETYLYTLVEHQSQADELMPFRLLEYMVKIWRQFISQQKTLKLPTIYPLIYYNGKQSPYPHSTALFDGFANPTSVQQILKQPFQLIDLTQIPDDALKQHKLAAALELIQKHIWDRDIGLLLNAMLNEKLWQKMLNEAPEHQGSQYLNALLYYAVEIGEMQDPDLFFKNLVVAAPNDKYRGEIMTIAEQFKQIGRNEGLHKGMLLAAEKLFKNGHGLKYVADITGLPESQLVQIQMGITPRS